MFLSAVARPRYIGNVYWDGKIGMWPLTERVRAQRRSALRPAGVMVTEKVNMDQVVYKRMMLELVLPAIQQKCPEGMRSNRIYLQQDSAPAHLRFSHAGCPELRGVCRDLGLDLVPFFQPAQSPELNVLDLGFHRALQTRVLKDSSTTIDELVDRVQVVFREYDALQLDKVFLTLQSVIDVVLHEEGGAVPAIPHLGKDRLIRTRGRLPRRLRVSDEVVALYQMDGDGNDGDENDGDENDGDENDGDEIVLNIDIDYGSDEEENEETTT